MGRISVVTVLGTRPEIIRLSRVLALLDQHTDHTLVHTGQNYDPKLNQVFFDEMGIRPPDVVLDTDTSSLGAFLGSVLRESEALLQRVRPDALLVLGDTNSSIVAVIARRMHITVFHMEAGNRCFDDKVPEEVNRRIIDHVADFNLVYTEHARRNLLREGLEPRRIYLTGSPLREVMTYYRAGILASHVLERMGLEPQHYLLVSMHREENVDDPDTLRTLVATFVRLAENLAMPVIVSTHPRTQQRLTAAHLLESSDRVLFCPPFGFFDYNRLQLECFCVLSDSGSISEESAILQFPAVTIRNSMERPEAMDTATMTLTGIDPDVIEQAVTLVVEQHRMRPPPVPTDYQIENTSNRVVNLILGTARLNPVWNNMAPRSPQANTVRP